MYADNEKKIRRFLRDPDEKIWDDTFLRNLWNTEQKFFARQIPFMLKVEVLRHPPQYHYTYMHDWEWQYADPDVGRPYQTFLKHRQSGYVCTYFWEIQQLGIGTGSESDTGYRYTHPWEGYMVGTPAELIPNWFPVDFQQAEKVFFDEEPIEFITWKKLVSKDIAYRSYTGDPQWWTIRDQVSREFYLYPRPSAVWDDIDGNSDTGMVLHSDFTAEADETGVPIDATGAETTADLGLLSDYLRTADNILMIYKTGMADIKSANDDPGISRYFQKYIEYGVLSRAYRANNDGSIKSLADYWTWRKSLGAHIINQYIINRLADRDFRLTSGRRSPRRRRGPRLPSTYPDV